jgi:aromatic ring hydroxylase
MTKLEELKITSANARAAVDATYDAALANARAAVDATYDAALANARAAVDATYDAAHDAYKEELEKQENSND